MVARDSIHEDLDPDIVRLRRLLSLFFDSFDIADMQVPPEQVCIGDRNGDQITTVDRHSRSLLRRRLAHSFFVPSAKADLPER